MPPTAPRPDTFSISLSKKPDNSQLSSFRDMIGAQSAKSYETALKGPICTLTLQPSDTTFDGAHQNRWTNDWFQPEDTDAFVLVHGPVAGSRGVSNVTINGTVHETATLYSLAETDVTAISRSHHPKGKKRIVNSFRAQAFVLQDKDRAWMLALSRQEEGPVDIELAHWHPVSRMTATRLFLLLQYPDFKDFRTPTTGNEAKYGSFRDDSDYEQATTLQPATETDHLPALKYIASISSWFSARVPPDDANYDLTASQTTFKNDNPATDQENTQAILQFVRQKLHIKIWPTNSRDAFVRARDSTVRLPTVDMFLGGEGIGARVMRGVSGSMRLPDPAQATSSEARSMVELDVTLVDGPELDKKFDTTICFDARPEGMLFEAGTQAGEEEGEVSTPGRFFGRVVLPPPIPRRQLVDLARLIVSPSWPTTLALQRTAEPERHSEQDSDSGSEGSLAPTYAETATTDATSV